MCEDTRPPYFEYLSDVQNAQKIILKTFRGKMKITVINRHTTDSDIDARHTGGPSILTWRCASRCHTCRSAKESYCAEVVLEFDPDPDMLVPSEITCIEDYDDVNNVYIKIESPTCVINEEVNGFPRHDRKQVRSSRGSCSRSHQNRDRNRGNCPHQRVLSTKSTHRKRNYFRRISRH